MNWTDFSLSLFALTMLSLSFLGLGWQCGLRARREKRQSAGDGGVKLSALVRYGRHEPDCDTCHDNAFKQRPKCTCGLSAAIAALRANAGDKA